MEAQIPKQELDAVADLRYSWQKVLHAAAGMGEVLLQERVSRLWGQGHVNAGMLSIGACAG